MNMMEMATNLLKRKTAPGYGISRAFLVMVVMVMKLMMVMCKSESERILPGLNFVWSLGQLLAMFFI